MRLYARLVASREEFEFNPEAVCAYLEASVRRLLLTVSAEADTPSITWRYERWTWDGEEPVVETDIHGDWDHLVCVAVAEVEG